MTLDVTGLHPSQAFRLHTPPGSSTQADIVKVKTRIDTNTGRHIVLWKDVKSYFKNAKCAMKAGEIVAFLADENLGRLKPRRIDHHPGVVLDVVVDSARKNTIDRAREKESLRQAVFTGPAAPSSAMGMPTKAIDLLRYTSSSYAAADEAESVTQQVTDLSISDQTSSNKCPVVCLTEMTQQLTMSSQACLSQYTLQLRDIQRGQNDIVAEVRKNRSLQEQIFLLQQQMDEKDRIAQKQLLEAQQQLLENQEQILQTQQQALDRLAIIQSRVQAVLTQTYELHEYPIPRLFIVLPKASRRRDKLLNPFSDQYRLYFLCECGSHTMSEGTKIPHKVHLAKHEGYDLSRPNEFFKKYGFYVLTLMQMIKYGITIAGVVVPSLAHFKIVDGIDAVQEQLQFVKENFGQLVDNTIDFIEDQQQNNKDNKDGVYAAEGQTRMDKLEVLEGADLRQLESYLRVQDKGRTLGNLYRTVTEEGHVKWVCIDHFRENYRESAVQQLRDVVAVNSGAFDEEQSRVYIFLRSALQAKEFYEALVKARRVHELTVELQWGMTLDDHRKFRSAITNANVSCLTMIIFRMKRPALDLINRYRRFDPIMGLLSDRRLQAFTLEGSENFFSRTSTSFIRPAPQLRTLSIQPIHLEDTASQTTFARLLQNCPNLTKLQLGTWDLSTIFDIVMHNIKHLSNLKELGLFHGRSSEDHIVIDLLKGEVQGAWAKLAIITSFEPSYLQFFRRGLLTQLTITNTVIDQAKGSLPEIIHRNPRLLEVKLSCRCAQFLGMLNLIISGRKRGRADGYVYAPLRLDFTNYSDDIADDCIISAVHLSERSDALDMSTDIRLRFGSRPDHNYLSSLINRYGWSIKILDTLSGELSDDIAQQLDKSTEEKGSRITTLMLDTYGLSSAGLECMARVMDRSGYLQEFQLYVRNPLINDAVESRLLHRHREVLTGLRVHVASHDSHIPWLAETFLSRRDVRRLKYLHFMCLHSKVIFPQEYVPWLAAMVSSSSDPFIHESSSPQSLTNPQALPSTESAADTSTAWEPLQEFRLSGFSLEPEDWKTIIEALDFSKLRTLRLSRSNFSIEQFKTLVDCISDAGPDVPLEHVDFRGSDLSVQRMPSEMQQLRKTLNEKAPQISLYINVFKQ